jgi:hypothetical protein
MLNTKIEDTASVLGIVPTNMSPRFQAPTLWGTIAEVANYLDSTERTSDPTQELTRDQASQVQTLLVSFFEKEIKPLMAQTRVGLVEEDPFFEYARQIKDSLVAQTENLFLVRTRLEALERARATPSQTSHSASTKAWLGAGVGFPKVPTSVPDDVVPALSIRVDRVESNIQTLISEGNSDAITFGGLGHRSVDDTRAWATRNKDAAEAFGLFPDCFSILEWMQHTERDNLTEMKTLRKLGVSTLAEVKAMAAFDSILPRVLIGSGSLPMVVMKNESSFPAVKTFAYWSNQGAGMRSKLSDDLKSIREGIYNQIKMRLSPGSTESNLAMLSLNMSVTWLESLFNFIDDTYESLTRSGFPVGAAWGLTTRLVMRIFEDISLVRAGVSSSFVMGDNMSNATTVLWATFKTHDVMENYSTHKFMNHPSISSEYVKFLAQNSALEAVVKLTDGFKKLESDAKESASKLTLAIKRSDTASSKIDTFGTKLAAIEKRLLKMEQK